MSAVPSVEELQEAMRPLKEQERRAFVQNAAVACVLTSPEPAFTLDRLGLVPSMTRVILAGRGR